MAKQLLSKRKAKALTTALFLLGLVLLAYLKTWWPGIMLVIGLPLALRQYLLGRRYDMGVTLFVFLGVFITVAFNISWEVLLPVLFAVGGLYLLFREFLEDKEESLVEKEEDRNKEIEENQHQK